MKQYPPRDPILEEECLDLRPFMAESSFSDGNPLIPRWVLRKDAVLFDLE